MSFLQNNWFAVTSPIATAQSSAVIVCGELVFRYSINATNGNLEVQSSSSAPVPVRSYGEEFFPAIGSTRNMTQSSASAPAAGAVWLPVPAGGLGGDEMLSYQIFTATNVYQVRLYNFSNANIHMTVQKAF
jgi:hypothetical protein